MGRKVDCPGIAVRGTDPTCLGCGRVTSVATGRLEHRRGLPRRTGPAPARQRRTRALLTPAQLQAVAAAPDLRHPAGLDDEEQRLVDAWWRGFDQARDRSGPSRDGRARRFAGGWQP